MVRTIYPAKPRVKLTAKGNILDTVFIRTEYIEATSEQY